MKPTRAELDAELRSAYLEAISAKDGAAVTVSVEAFTYLYRMGLFHVPIPKWLKRWRERLT